MTSDVGQRIKNILLVDDDQDSLDMLIHLLGEKIDSEIIPSKYPTQAKSLAQQGFFDFILLDVTIDYQGTPFGGLELYKSLIGRYGRSSLIAYSQFITDELLQRYSYNFEFLEKGSNLLDFVANLVKTLHDLRSRQTCFIAMPFDRKYDPIYKVIEDTVSKYDYQCVRLDQEDFTTSIVEKMYHAIQECKFMVFLATDKNPNAFYECGYAVALKKEILTVTDYYKNLPFDIRDRNAIEYKNDLGMLQNELDAMLEGLIRKQ